MKAIAFDLDDTLYDELTYVQSGFREVANYLHRQYNLEACESFAYMWQWLERKGRGAVFDQTLRHYGLFSKKEARQCVTVYRKHIPDIKLSAEGERCLTRLKHYPVYIVTDGNKLVQHNKLMALGLYERVKHCFITHRHGIRHAKPSPYCFEKIAKRERCRPDEIVYIGDNPRKDFVGLKPLGFKTIRIRQGQHKNIIADENYEAEVTIESLDQVNEDLLSHMNWRAE